MYTLIPRIFQFQGAAIRYYTFGNLTNDTLVLLHPAFSNHSIFQKQIEVLGAAYHLILVDMPGHGESQVGRSKVRMGNMPEIIKGLLEEHKISRAHIAGVSLGSLVAQGVAHFYPEMIQSVTLIGSFSVHKDNEALLKAQNAEMGKWLLRIMISMKRFREYVTVNSVHSDFGRCVFRESTKYFKLSSFPAMQGIDRFFVKKEDPVEYPLLIVCGEFDLEIAKEASKRLSHLEKNAQYVEIKGAGHCANIDAPEKFNTIFMDFLKGHRGR